MRSLTHAADRNYIVVINEEGGVMRAQIVQIGNSQGIRLPKALLEQTGLSGEVELKARDNEIVIRPLRKPREGWDEAFRAMAQNGDDQLLDAEAISLTQWDESEWEW